MTWMWLAPPRKQDRTLAPYVPAPRRIGSARTPRWKRAVHPSLHTNMVCLAWGRRIAVPISSGSKRWYTNSTRWARRSTLCARRACGGAAAWGMVAVGARRCVLWVREGVRARYWARSAHTQNIARQGNASKRAVGFARVRR